MDIVSHLRNVVPNTFTMFQNHLMFSYGATVHDFEQKSEYEKYKYIKGYFGYSRDLPQHLDIKLMTEEIRALFIDYEKIISKKIPNLWLELKDMSNSEKTEWLRTRMDRILNISLCDAITKSINQKIFSLSLKDSIVDLPEYKKFINVAPIVDRKMNQIAVATIVNSALDIFWNNAKTERDEEPPF